MNNLHPKDESIIRHLMEGSSAKEIATFMSMKEQTVEARICRMLKKSKCKNRVQLVASYLLSRKATS